MYSHDGGRGEFSETYSFDEYDPGTIFQQFLFNASKMMKKANFVNKTIWNGISVS